MFKEPGLYDKLESWFLNSEDELEIRIESMKIEIKNAADRLKETSENRLKSSTARANNLIPNLTDVINNTETDELEWLQLKSHKYMKKFKMFTSNQNKRPKCSIIEADNVGVFDEFKEKTGKIQRLRDYFEHMMLQTKIEIIQINDDIQLIKEFLDEEGPECYKQLDPKKIVEPMKTEAEHLSKCRQLLKRKIFKMTDNRIEKRVTLDKMCEEMSKVQDEVIELSKSIDRLESKLKKAKENFDDEDKCWTYDDLNASIEPVNFNEPYEYDYFPAGNSDSNSDFEGFYYELSDD